MGKTYWLLSYIIRILLRDAYKTPREFTTANWIAAYLTFFSGVVKVYRRYNILYIMRVRKYKMKKRAYSRTESSREKAFVHYGEIGLNKRVYYTTVIFARFSRSIKYFSRT